MNLRSFLRSLVAHLAVLAAMIALLWAVGSPASAHDVTRPHTLQRSIDYRPLGNDYSVDLRLTELGGCTYVVARLMGSPGTAAVTHHAACQNPMHRGVLPSTSSSTP